MSRQELGQICPGHLSRPQWRWPARPRPGAERRRGRRAVRVTPPAGLARVYGGASDKGHNVLRYIVFWYMHTAR